VDVTVSKILLVVSIIIFVLAAFGVNGSSHPVKTETDMIAIGLAVFASAHL